MHFVSRGNGLSEYRAPHGTYGNRLRQESIWRKGEMSRSTSFPSVEPEARQGGVRRLHGNAAQGCVRVNVPWPSEQPVPVLQAAWQTLERMQPAVLGALLVRLDEGGWRQLAGEYARRK